MAEPSPDDNPRGSDWRQLVVIPAGLVVATAVVCAVRGATVRDAWQTVFGSFGVVVALVTAVALWLASAILIGHGLRQEHRSQKRSALLWATVALAMACAYAWGLFRWWNGDAS
jgi:carbon starvation protein CstA